MKKLSVGKFILLTFVTLVCLAATRESHADILTVVQGRILFASFNGKYKEIFRTKSPFYGYGWLDKEEIFVAYQPDGEAEASAVIEVFNLRTGKKKKITEIGAAGESHFAAHPRLRKIVFNDTDGIEVLTIENFLRYKITTVSRDRNAFAPYWIDDNTIGYISFSKKGGSTFKKVSITPR
ncbi:hypothetical protein [Geotalea sp. SG265]|uniref:hypothetical protein n=1 Tax=Geotalea sp. SG265 TaxID=2922867 RepID=UPI001FAF0E81|nr:hypothetical protein [Geotalea sp. SG265]